MDKSRILILIDRNIHMRLKSLAMQQKVTLNQICIDMINAGISHSEQMLLEHQYQLSEINIQTEKTKLSDKIQNFIEASIREFTHHGIISIIEPREYVANYVFVFNEMGIPVNFYATTEIILQKLEMNLPRTQIIQAMELTKIVESYNIMWAKVAENGKVLWSLTPDIESKINELFLNQKQTNAHFL